MKKQKITKNDEGNISQSAKSLSSFSLYCLDHPEERFFQALRNWFGVGYIGFSGDRKEWTDTFYLKEGEDYEIL